MCWTSAKVSCLAGSRANERPISFFLDAREIRVRTILKTWREPGRLFFKIESEEGCLYVLLYDEYPDLWQAKETPVRDVINF